MSQASSNFNSNSQSGKSPQQPNTDLVTCIKCGGHNRRANMRHYHLLNNNEEVIGDAWICDFCQMDESEPIPYRLTAPNVADLTDTELAQGFVDHHCSPDGDKSLAREYLAELIRRDTQRQAIESLKLSERLVAGQNGGYFQALRKLARMVSRG